MAAFGRGGQQSICIVRTKTETKIHPHCADNSKHSDPQAIGAGFAPMSSTPVTRAVVVQNPQGLHARPAELFARMALQFESRIALIRNDQRVDGKSILEILTLGVLPGTELILEAEGDDAQQAVEALATLVESHFGHYDNGNHEQRV